MDTARIIDDSLSQFETNLKAVLATYSRQVERLMLSNLTRQGRVITFNDANVNFIIQNQEALYQLLQSSGWTQLVTDFINSENDLLREYRSARPAEAIAIEFTQKDLSQLTALRRSELFQFEQLGRSAVSTLQTGIMQGVLTGADTMYIADLISTQLEDRLQRYAWTYANTARANYLQTVEDINAERGTTTDDLFWEYVGPEDDKTRDACIEGLSQQYFTDSERELFEAATAEERAWNCRHKFIQISEKAYENSK